MVDSNYLSPPLYAALAMIASYYVNSQLILFLLVIFLIIIYSFISSLHIFIDIRKILVISLSLIIGFSLGIFARQGKDNSLQMGLLQENIIAVSGILIEDPRSLQAGLGYGILDLQVTVTHNGIRSSAKGELTVFFPEDSIADLKEFGRASTLYLEGSFGRGNSSNVFYAASVHITTPPPVIEAFRTNLRHLILERFSYMQGSNSEWGNFASALLLGVRDNLDTNFTDSFRNSGTSHILALSGMHLAVISLLLSLMLKPLLGIRYAALAGAVFICLYVFLAGAQTSLIRSLIMYLLGVFALWTSLKTKGLTLLATAFILQLLFQNKSGTSISFMLSYLALFGMITLGKSIYNLLKGKLPEILSSSLSFSLAAFLVTSPLVAYYFNTLRPIGIITGIIIAPLSTLFMILSLAALLFSFVPLPIWSFFAFLLDFLYGVINNIVSVSSLVPGINISEPFWIMLFSIIIFVLLILFAAWDEKRRLKIEVFN